VTEDVLNAARKLLTEAGFEVIRARYAEDALCFEDDTIIGAIVVFESYDALAAHWEQRQTQFFSSYSERLRAAREKAWNTYQVLVWVGEATVEQRAGASRIEEDLRVARKIVAWIPAPSRLALALNPFMPLRSPSLLWELADDDALRKRLDMLPAQAVEILTGNGTVEEVWEAVKGRQ
jgi:hypothetical protein